MLKPGDTVLIKRGIFLNHTGVIEHEFHYNGLTRYTISIHKNKNLENKFIATCSEHDVEPAEPEK